MALSTWLPVLELVYDERIFSDPYILLNLVKCYVAWVTYPKRPVWNITTEVLIIKDPSIWMMNSRIINVQDGNAVYLFEQVLGQMIGRLMQSGNVSKHQMVASLEDLIQQVERGTLDNSLRNM